MIKKYFSLVLLAIIGQAVQAASDEANYLSIDPFYIEPGGVVTVNLNLINSDEICAYQTDLVLPEGIRTKVETIEGTNIVSNPGVKMITDRTYEQVFHEIAVSEQQNGGTRIVCYSNQNVCFTGTSGAIATITLQADDDIPVGVYEIKLSNSEVVNESNEGSNPSEYLSSAIVGVTSDGTLTLAGAYNEETIAVLNTALTEKSGVNVIDMTGVTSFDGEVNVNGNPNTLIYTSSEIGVTNKTNVVVDGTCNNLVLTEGYAFSTPTAFNVENANYTRILNGTLWNSLYMPFDIPFSVFGENYDVAYINKVEDSNDGMVMLIEIISEEESATLSANTPYFVRAKEGCQELTIKVQGGSAIQCKAEENRKEYTTDGKTIEVFGNYHLMTQTDLSGCYAISKQGMWQPAGESATLLPFRTYLKMTSSNGTQVQAIRIHASDATTEIKNEVMLDTDNSIIVYDLQGRRVEKPTKGIYIVNGKKVCVNM